MKQYLLLIILPVLLFAKLEPINSDTQFISKERQILNNLDYEAFSKMSDEELDAVIREAIEIEDRIYEAQHKQQIPEAVKTPDEREMKFRETLNKKHQSKLKKEEEYKKYIKTKQQKEKNQGSYTWLYYIIGISLFAYLTTGRKKNKEQQPTKQIDEDKKKTEKKYTLNPIKMAKYTKLIYNSDKIFADIYNFDTPSSNKTPDRITMLANTVLFEEARKNKLVLNDFEIMIQGLSVNDGVGRYIKPVGNDMFDFETYSKLYTLYNDYRAQQLRPIIAMMATVQAVGDTPFTDKDLTQLNAEYSTKPFFGDKL